MLTGAKGHLTHLSLMKVGTIELGDLCRVLIRCGSSLQELKIVGCRIANSGNDSDLESDSEDPKGNDWQDQDESQTDNDAWVSSGPKQSKSNRKLGRFEKALSHCVNLTNLVFEPGSIPVETAPIALFKPLQKLETLTWNKRHVNNLAPEVWLSLLGLGPVLLEKKRKIKCESNRSAVSVDAQNIA